MAQPIGPLTSTNNYSDNTLQGLWSSGFLFAGANPINVEIEYGTPEAATDTIHDLYCPAGQSVNFSAPSTQAYPNIYVTQVRFKSANAGQAATVSGYFNEPRAPAIIAGIGGGTPTNVALGVQHNGTAVASQPTLDFVDATGVAFAVANDSVNTRITVSATSQPPVGIVSLASTTETITSGATTDLLGDTTVAGGVGNVFTGNLGSVTTLGINANNPGFYIVFFNWQWNSGSVDVNQQTGIITAPFIAGGTVSNAFKTTSFGTDSMSVAGYYGSNSPATIHPQLYQASGSNQTLSKWEMTVVKVSF